MEQNNIYRSEQINLIMGAFAKAQGSYKKLVPNEASPSGLFANLDAILDATKEALSQNGLGFYQFIELLDEGSGAALLKTVLGHESGQWISSCARVVSGKTDRQTGNNYETYKRLHALMLLGIAPSKNDPIAFDDNSNEQIQDYTLEQLKKPKEKREIDHNSTVSKEQYDDLMIELDGYPEIVNNIKEVYDIDTLADLPKSEYHPALAKIRKIKRLHEDFIKGKK